MSGSHNKSRHIHSNSLDAYDSERPKLTGRRQQIFDYINRHPRVSDRQVMIALGFTDMNAVRPRITELVKLGLVEEVGSIRCRTTRKRCRLVQVKLERPQQLGLLKNEQEVHANVY